MTKKISFFLPSLNIGGIERVFICYANNLVKRNYSIDFVLCKREGLLLTDVSPEVNMVFLEVKKLRFVWRKLREYLKRETPDVVITGGDYSNIMLTISALGLHPKPQIVISQHNYNNIEGRSLGYWARTTQLWMKLIYPIADQIIAISEGIKSYLCNDIHVPCRKIVVINNPIDIDYVYTKSKEKVVVQLPDSFIVFIGRISPVKNLPLLLQAYEKANINNISLVIVGDGPELSYIKQIIHGLNKRENIYCIGEVNNPLPILAKAKVLVLPSFSEAFPTILLEAMCLNKAIVATPTKGALEILSEVKGMYISSSFDNPSEFSKLIEDSINVGNINAIERVSSYSKESVINSFEEKIIKS